MQLLNYLFLTNFISKLYYSLFYILIFGIFIGFSLFFGSKISSRQYLLKTFSSVFFIRFLLLTTFTLSTILLVLIFIYYLQYINYIFKFFFFNAFFIYSEDFFPKIIISSSLLLSIDFFGLILCFLAFSVGLLSFLALDTRFYWKNVRFIFMCNVLILVVFLFTSVNNILLLFFFYECLLIPSFLFVYFVSPYRRSIQASLYFLIWTQIGSLFVLVAVAYIFMLTNATSFKFIQNFPFTSLEILVLFYLFFFGFGVKIPIWPFHQWLTKTHVEAPAGFSMFLSGFLVKSALFGFYKLTHLLGGEINTSLCVMILLFGVLDASLKMWGQTDLKKLIAYGTVQEMNMIFLLFCWGTANAFWGGILFCITHSFLSALLFYTVDCVQRRFHTRSIPELAGILQTHPHLGLVIFLNCVFYSGLPGTLKFISELYLYNGLLENSFILGCILFFGCNYLGLIGFCKCWYNVLFGLTINNKQIISIDLTIKEILIILTCYFFLIFTVLIDNIFLH